MKGTEISYHCLVSRLLDPPCYFAYMQKDITVDHHGGDTQVHQSSTDYAQTAYDLGKKIPVEYRMAKFDGFELSPKELFLTKNEQQEFRKGLEDQHPTSLISRLFKR